MTDDDTPTQSHLRSKDELRRRAYYSERLHYRNGDFFGGIGEIGARVEGVLVCLAREIIARCSRRVYEER